MKKLLAMVLALVMTLSLAVSANAAFKDADKVSEDYSEAVAVLNGMGVFKGYEDGSFQPQGDITRAEVAAIVYRVYTKDVKDAKASLYATYNKFSDMTGAGWAAGYIGYCANAELVKGYPNGTFQPSGKVTGYEVLAMILRAIGYDKNGEFSGSDWALHVAQTAQQAHVLDNVKGVDLNAPATRELVAELLFRAIADAPMVTYTAAFGYQTVSFSGSKADSKLFKDNETLGHKNFELDDKADSDDWGRPATTWEYNVGDKSTTVVDKPDASFNVATTECDICAALGIKKSADVVEIYTNGVKKGTDTLTATETKAKLGAQGQQIEFYENKDGDYRMVVIDTYLAYVNEVVEKKVDSKDHTTRDAYLALDVYKTDDGKATTLYVKGNDYAEDAYLLVHVNAVDKTDIITVTNAKPTSYPTVEVVGEAKSFTGAQSKIYHDSNKHTIGGEDYMDAYRFYKDVADGSSIKYTWFLDQFGNLIGSDLIDNTSYAVLKNIYWTSTDRNGYAKATLVDLDGKETEVEVDTIDGIADDANAQEAKPADGEEFTGAFVSHLDNNEPRVNESAKSGKFDSKYAYMSIYDNFNGAYNGMALFMVQTNDDGSVKLQGYDEVKYAKNATLNPTSSVLSVFSSDEDDATVTTKYALSTNTKFIVREGNADDGYTYNTDVTLRTLKEYADKSVEVYFVTDGKYATTVYIKNATDASAFGTYIFVPEANNSNWWTDPKTGNDYFNVYVDGEAQTIEIAKDNNAVAKFLSKNEGKLIMVQDGHLKDTWDKSLSSGKYGMLKSVAYLEVVNEANDAAKWLSNTVIADYISDYEFDKDNTILVSKVKDAASNADFNVIDLDKAKVVVWDNADAKDVKITKDTFEEYGVWAVTAETKYEGSATTLYLGKKLDADLGLDITVDPTAAGTVTSTAGAYTFTGAAGVTSATLKFAASSAKSTVDKTSATANTNDQQITVTVTNEAGFSKTYTITVKLTAAEQATVNYVLKANVNGVEETYTGTWTGPAGTYSGQELETIRGAYFPTFKVAAGNYTLVTDNSTVTAVAGETVTLTYVVNVH